MKICKSCKQPKGQPHLPDCTRKSFIGIWQTRAGYFVRVEKRGIVWLRGKQVDGFLGYKLLLNGRRNGDWLAFDMKGNAQVNVWDLMERKINNEGVTGSKKVINWPPDLGVESDLPAQ